MRWTEGTIDAAGVEIHYVRTGDGGKPPVVFIHGFTDNGRCWTRLAQALESAFDVVMVDSRNHGASATAIGSCSDIADDVAAVVVQLGLDPAAVVGHSLGAIAAAELAVRHPGLVTRLVLEDPPWRRRRVSGSPAGDSIARASAIDVRRQGLQSFIDSFDGLTHDQIVAMGREQHPGWHDLDFPAWGQSKQQVRPEAIESITPHEWAGLVPELQCSTLLIHGQVELGGIVGPGLAADIAGLSPLVSIAEIAGAGHNVRREGFEAYLGIVGPFVSGS